MSGYTALKHIFKHLIHIILYIVLFILNFANIQLLWLPGSYSVNFLYTIANPTTTTLTVSNACLLGAASTTFSIATKLSVAIPAAQVSHTHQLILHGQDIAATQDYI